ncbi:hypothetical protein CEXT_414891 [Caerostris extrusa]|uniref:Uncharacterized protein n=1 Tax=Caerostris extrusa TaxID=172846 RepID=A0AAV4VP69_CAEEX|nr:hypothetical protein CEXT_414891 [Caerostris extrusa]
MAGKKQTSAKCPGAHPSSPSVFSNAVLYLKKRGGVKRFRRNVYKWLSKTASEAIIARVGAVIQNYDAISGLVGYVLRGREDSVAVLSADSYGITSH